MKAIQALRALAGAPMPGIAFAVVMVLAVGLAVPQPDAKGRRGKSSSSAKSGEAEAKSTNVNINTGSRSSNSSASPQAAASQPGGTAVAVGAAALAAAAAANAASGSGNDDFAKRKAEWEKSKAEKAAASASAPQSGASAAMAAAAGKSNAAATTATAAVTLPVGGQGQVFRIVDKNGRVTFSDRVPNEQGLRVTEGVGRSGLVDGATSAGAFGNLPPAVATVAGRYPVTLYSGEGCDPCNQARAMLVARGVPFSERTVKTNEDIEALQRLAGTAGLPFMTVGGQQIRGFSDTELMATLDAADYPKTSALPPNYRNPSAQPMVQTTRVAANSASNATTNAAGTAGGTGAAGGTGDVVVTTERPRRERAPVAASDAGTVNPAGIKF